MPGSQRLREVSERATSVASTAMGKGRIWTRILYRANSFRAMLHLVIVLVFGGALFSWLEKSNEIVSRHELADFVARANLSLPRQEYGEMLALLGVTEESLQSHAPHNWDFVGACFFCFTAATTIGYGNYTPSTDSGKIFLVFYSIVAIPMCLKAYVDITDMTLNLVVAAISQRKAASGTQSQVEHAFQMFDADRSGKLEYGEVVRALAQVGYDVETNTTSARSFDEHIRGVQSAQGVAVKQVELDIDDFRSLLQSISPDAEKRLELTINKGRVVLLTLAIFILMVAISTLIFGATRRAENWSYLDAFYFTVVTFTTIGFGDFSPDPHPFWFGTTFIVVCFFGLSVTATLVRAASDPDFSLAATLRGIMPRTCDCMRLFSIKTHTCLSQLIGYSVSRTVPHQTDMSTELSPYS